MELFKFLLFILLSFSQNAFSYRITGATSGINAASGERPARRDLRSFQSSGAAFDLYIQALQMLQATNQANLLSHFEIAGIRKYLMTEGLVDTYFTVQGVEYSD